MEPEQINIINQDDSDDTQHPAHYLKCEKFINNQWVNTGWAPDIKAADQHAVAIGGSVRATNNDLAVVYERHEALDNESELCDKNCPEHS